MHAGARQVVKGEEHKHQDHYSHSAADDRPCVDMFERRSHCYACVYTHVYSDADALSCSNTHALVHFDVHVHAYTRAYCNTYTFDYPSTRAHTDTGAYPYTHPRAYCNAYADGHTSLPPRRQTRMS